MSLNEGTGSEISFRRVRSSTAAVMSTLRAIEKSGAVAFDSAMRRETVCWSRVSSSTWTSPLGPTPAASGSFFAGSPRSASFFSAFLSFFLPFLSFLAASGSATSASPFAGASSAASASPFAGASLVAAPPFSAAAWTSAFTIRPPGPVPSS